MARASATQARLEGYSIEAPLSAPPSGNLGARPPRRPSSFMPREALRGGEGRPLDHGVWSSPSVENTCSVPYSETGLGVGGQPPPHCPSLEAFPGALLDRALDEHPVGRRTPPPIRQGQPRLLGASASTGHGGFSTSRNPNAAAVGRGRAREQQRVVEAGLVGDVGLVCLGVRRARSLVMAMTSSGRPEQGQHPGQAWPGWRRPRSA